MALLPGLDAAGRVAADESVWRQLEKMQSSWAAIAISPQCRGAARTFGHPLLAAADFPDIDLNTWERSDVSASR
jgi:hypothetical protein